jgi:hypothetical protein
MVKLGVANSRMKDFYDLQVISSRLAFDGKTLSEAVRKTFLNRCTEFPANGMPLAFMPEFYDDTNKKRQWTAFCAFCAKNATYMAKTNSTQSSKHRRSFSFPLWQLCTRELCSHYSGSPRSLARNRTCRLKGVTQK